jgi:hypothetical protein
MKKIFVFVALTLVMACGQNTTKDRSYLPESVGSINTLQVVAPNEVWTGPVGDSIRQWFAAPTPGLPQIEPLFNISQIAPEHFTDFARSARLILSLEYGDRDTVSLKTNAFARPQLVAEAQGTSEQSLIDLVRTQNSKWIAQMKAFELKERQRRTQISPKTPEGLAQAFGIELLMPSAYRTAASSNEYYWLRKDLPSNGTTNILVYNAPLSIIPEEAEHPVSYIRHIRDAVGARLLPVEDDSRFITDTTYVPSSTMERIEGRSTIISRGIWTLSDAFMGGPYLNMAIKDTTNNRYLIVEGFSYAPSMAKRDLQFELESILRTIKFVKGSDKNRD